MIGRYCKFPNVLGAHPKMFTGKINRILNSSTNRNLYEIKIGKEIYRYLYEEEFELLPDIFEIWANG